MRANGANDLIWYDAETPDVSIIVVNFKNISELAGCLSSVWTHTAGHKYEVVVVDNGSGAEEVNGIRALGEQLRLISLNENRYFGDGSNIGVEHAKGRYVVFLNNDCHVTENWLQPLIATLEQQPFCGGVGPKFLYPDGRVQEIGTFTRSDGWSIQVGKQYPPLDHDEVYRTHVVDYCSAACFVTTRKLFVELGGFDPIFSPAYFEDVDLAFRIAEIGLFIYCCPQSTIYHQENATSRKCWTEGQLQRLVHRNRALFFDRWRYRLTARANGSTLPHATNGKAGAAELTVESDLKAARGVARLDWQVGYLSAVISHGGGELSGLQAERDQRLFGLNAVQAVLKQHGNADRIDLKERESEFNAAIAALSGRIADIENKMQRELAALSTAREELKLINPN
jgi:GT2 family glycosyltransferase